MTYGWDCAGNDQGVVRVGIADFLLAVSLVVDEAGAFKVIGTNEVDGEYLRKAAIQGYDHNGRIYPTFNGGQLLVRELYPDRGIWDVGASRGRDEGCQLVVCATLYGTPWSMFAGRVQYNGVFDTDFGEEGVQVIDTEHSVWISADVMTLHANGDILMGHHGHIYWLLGNDSAQVQG
ncbi:MAG: hypothetical protein P4N59_13015 [Negativicutes bacterium]|nr:hypothetical protein [Negativicutes bacterium]